MTRRNIQKDNDLFDEKVRQRRRALRLLDTPPIVLECYGGWGKLGSACYADVSSGVVLEKNPDKTAVLSVLRPTWGVYECDTVAALQNGIGKEWDVNVLDVDPYGDPHPTINAFFTSGRPRTSRIIVVVHDGLKNVVMMGKAWTTESLRPMVEKYGQAYVQESYLAVCRELLGMYAAPHGYREAFWWGIACGHHQKQALYTAMFVKD